MTMKMTVDLTEAEQRVYDELMKNQDVLKEHLVMYILETVHIGHDDLDTVVNSLLC